MSIKHICENGLLVATGPPTLTYYTMSAFETTKLKRWSTIHRHSKPSLFRSYFELNRLHKFPTGTLFVFWPCAWGLTMAAYVKGLPPSKLATLIFSYFIGSTIVHSAACVINDIFDRDFDRQVERTKMRPIASGDISVFDATVFLILQITVILCMLSFVNPLAYDVCTILFTASSRYGQFSAKSDWHLSHSWPISTHEALDQLATSLARSHNELGSYCRLGCCYGFHELECSSSVILWCMGMDNCL
ncbi:hypothetical protein AcV5_002953 [Taiwanofungus camphoratus]|nr:hypothetical protein AcV5_002953 [Antrodia cinnamomea]